MGSAISALLPSDVRTLQYSRLNAENINSVAQDLQICDGIIDISHADNIKWALDVCIKVSKPYMCGTTGLQESHFNMLKAAGIAKLRKDCVLAVEVLYSLPVNHTVNLGTFFEDCLTWTRANFGGVVLSFDVHLDESMPHAHALILPLIDGHMNGSDMVGNKYDLQLMHMSFHEVVGVLHALEKPANKPLGQAKLDTCRDVLDMLRSDPAMESQIWLPIRDSICNDPSPFAHVLGIQVTKPKARKERSFVDIMISKGKGSNIRESDTR